MLAPYKSPRVQRPSYQVGGIETSYQDPKVARQKGRQANMKSTAKPKEIQSNKLGIAQMDAIREETPKTGASKTIGRLAMTIFPIFNN